MKKSRHNSSMSKGSLQIIRSLKVNDENYQQQKNTHEYTIMTLDRPRFFLNNN